METTVTQRNVSKKSTKTAEKPASVIQQQNKSEKSPDAGVPLYLQSNHVQRQEQQEEEEELLQSKHDPCSSLLQRQAEDDDEKELLQPLPIQTRLTIGAVDDPLEKEADGVADQVMRSPSSTHTPHGATRADVSLQRFCTECAEEEVQTIKTKRTGSSLPQQVSKHVQHSISSPTGGSPLSGAVRKRIEPVLGRNLDHVRVHGDTNAKMAASSLHAKAFTHKNHIWLGHSQSAEDVGLMAHESAHVIQQGAGETKSHIQRDAEVGEGETSKEQKKSEDPRIKAINQIVKQTLDSETPSYKVVLHTLFTAKKIGGLHQLVAELRACDHSMYSTYFVAAMQTIRIHGNEKILQLIIGFLKKEGVTLETWEIAKEAADPLAALKLENKIDQLRAQLEKLDPNSTEYKSIEEYISRFEDKLEKVRPPLQGLHKEGGAYPRDVALYTSYLIRGGYIKEVAGLIPEAWRTMKQEQLTKILSEKFSEKELRTMFFDKYEARAAVKARFRKYNLVAAIAIGLIWAKDNIAEGEWDTAAAKVGGSGVAAYAFNKLLYARDLSAEAIMKRKGKEFGRWFQRAAGTSKGFNFLIRRVGAALLIWDLKDLLMSGGMGGPNIPFDLIVEIDIDDPGTWSEPNQTLLNLGFNIWYEQKCTEKRKEACTATPLYLAKVEGSLLSGLGKLVGLLPYNVAQLKNNLYRIEGELDLIGRKTVMVSASSNALVIATGKVSPGLWSFSKGDYKDFEVFPASSYAEKLLGGTRPRFVPEYVLNKIEGKV